MNQLTWTLEESEKSKPSESLSAKSEHKYVAKAPDPPGATTGEAKHIEHPNSIPKHSGKDEHSHDAEHKVESQEHQSEPHSQKAAKAPPKTEKTGIPDVGHIVPQKSMEANGKANEHHEHI